MVLPIDLKKSQLWECPICFEKLKPPISSCVNGHGTCSTCRKEMQHCGLCRGKFLKYKNTLLDEIINEIIEYELSDSLRSLHCEEEDPSKKDCFICGEKDINIAAINNHFSTKHYKCKVRRRAIGFVTPVLISIDLKKQDEVNTEKEKPFVLIYISDDGLNFIFRFFYNEKKQTLYFCLQFLGQKQNNASKYIFDMKINQGLSEMNRSFFRFSGKCVPYKSIINWEAEENENKVIGLKLGTILFNFNEELEQVVLELKIKKILS